MKEELPYIGVLKVWRGFTEANKERDVYALLLSVFSIEYGNNYLKNFFENNEHCFELTDKKNKGFTFSCFKNILEIIFGAFLESEKKFFVGMNIDFFWK